jgi:hypothetical protein
MSCDPVRWRGSLASSYISQTSSSDPCTELDFGHFWSVVRLSREEFRQRDASTGLRPGMRRRARLNRA